MLYSRSKRLNSNGKTAQIMDISYLSNVMIRQILPTKLNTRLWHQINQSPAEAFLAAQTIILNIIMSNVLIFNKYFASFYRNHLCLYHWYLLARENKSQMKQYIFFDLLCKNIEQYKQFPKNEIDIPPKFKRAVCKQNFPEFFYEKDNGKEGNDHIGIFRKNRLSALSKIKNIDYHQLFVNTFKACRGEKYMKYDFEKSKKGQRQRYTYNKFIRAPKTTQKSVNVSFLLTRIQYSSSFLQYTYPQKSNDCINMPLSICKLKQSPKRFVISRKLCKKGYSLHD